MEKVICLKLSSELGDGWNSSIVEMEGDYVETVNRAIRAFFDCDKEYIVGQSFSVEVLEMTREELASLPEN